MVLQFKRIDSVLLASMFASHTLIAYPIISKLGISKNKAVSITVGGTMITDTLALLVLTIIVGMATGQVNDMFWIRLGVSILIFALIVLFGFPFIGRWFFKHVHDNISQYIFVLVMVFLGSFLAQVAGMERSSGVLIRTSPKSPYPAKLTFDESCRVRRKCHIHPILLVGRRYVNRLSYVLYQFRDH